MAPAEFQDAVESLEAPLYSPFIERYILDELRSVRMDQQTLRAELAQRLADTRLDVSDRAIGYTTDTVNNVFFIITAAASVLVLMGWRSLKEVREKMEEVVGNRISDVTREYESRLLEVEEKLKKRSEQIIIAQENIVQSNQIHSLWMRANLTSNLQEKVRFYDEILKLSPDDVEAIVYKADTVLEMGESEWALHLSNKAVELDPDYALAFWQRACANVELEQPEDALADLRQALELSPNLRREIGDEPAFAKLRERVEFQELMEPGPPSSD